MFILFSKKKFQKFLVIFLAQNVCFQNIEGKNYLVRYTKPEKKGGK